MILMRRHDGNCRGGSHSFVCCQWQDVVSCTLTYTSVLSRSYTGYTVEFKVVTVLRQ